jgi:hypothetical protein
MPSRCSGPLKTKIQKGPAVRLDFHPAAQGGGLKVVLELAQGRKLLDRSLALT